MYKIIDGSQIAQSIKDEIRIKTDILKERADVVPGLAFLLVGDDPGSKSYVRSKEKACEYCGFHSTTVTMPADAKIKDILEQIDNWNIDPEINGILVQLPLPNQADEQKVIEAISPRKDVDGFHPINLGHLVIGNPGFVPCTPAGIQELLIRSKVELSGKHVVVVGRSNIVGKPIAAMLMQKLPHANAIVTIVHSAAPDISVFTRTADVLIVAIGRAGYVTGDMVKDGVVVIDVGINHVDAPDTPKGYRIAGDVDFDSVSQKASLITPVPKGVGPMTIAMLMKSTYQAALSAANLKEE
jgi:methylenetetrahydrofolate dehydrogenase (NADP+)/methenyltetrahydrofolate cyclohydrolase